MIKNNIRQIYLLRSLNNLFFFYCSTSIRAVALKINLMFSQQVNVVFFKFVTWVLAVVTGGSNEGRTAAASVLISFGSGMSSKISSGSDLSSGFVDASLSSSLNSLSEFKSISSAADRLLDFSSMADKSLDLSSSRDMSAFASTLICQIIQNWYFVKHYEFNGGGSHMTANI